GDDHHLRYQRERGEGDDGDQSVPERLGLDQGRGSGSGGTGDGGTDSGRGQGRGGCCAGTGGGDVLGTADDVAVAGLLGAAQPADGHIGPRGLLDAGLGAFLGEGLACTGSVSAGGCVVAGSEVSGTGPIQRLFIGHGCIPGVATGVIVLISHRQTPPRCAPVGGA